MLSKWCLTSGFVIFYGLKPQGLFALDSKIYRFSAWQLAHDLLSTGTKIMQSLSEVDSLSDWHVAFTSPWGPTKTILKLIDLHLFAVEMKNKMQMRHKGAQEIQRQSKGAGQSNVTTEFWSQLFPGFPRFQRKSSN